MTQMKKKKRRKRRMSKRRQAKLMILAGMALILLLIIIGIFSLIAKLFKKPDSLTLSPNFTEQELDINSDYTFSITGKPEKVKLKKIKYEIDSDIATFKAADTDKDKKDKDAKQQAILHTNAEGTITISVKISKVVSNTLTFTIVDKAAREAEAAQAALDAQMQQQQTQPQTESTGELVKTTTRVRIRSTPSTEGEILKTCDTNETFTKYGETDNGWGKIDYNGQEAYIKSDYLVPASENNDTAANNTSPAETAGNQATAKNTPKSAEPSPSTSQPSAPTPVVPVSTASNIPAQPDIQTPAQDPSLGQAPEDASPVEATAPPAVAAGSVPYTDKNGVSTTFTTEEWNYFLSYWDYTGQAEYFVHKHTCAELRAMYDATH